MLLFSISLGFFFLLEILRVDFFSLCTGSVVKRRRTMHFLDGLGG